MLEGVMMKGARSIATAVRTEGGDITVESKYIKSAKEKSAFFRMPFVRGVVNLVSQLYMGTGILMRSAEVYGDFTEPSKVEKKMADKLKINPMSVLMAISVIVGIALAVGLFVFIPNLATGALFKIPALASAPLGSLWYSLIEGGIMLAIFIIYIVAVSLMKDIRRVFMYHGAEHKVIACYEHGLDLTVENARKMGKEHSRCGTTFMFIVITVSILVFALINWGLAELGWLTDSGVLNALIRLGVKLLFLPVVAGISYEILKLLAKSDCLFVRILRSPGMLLQKLTTREPSDDMLEVSITAFKTVLAMDEDGTLPERKFEVLVPFELARKKAKETAKAIEDSDIDWILCEVTGLKRSELAAGGRLTPEQASEFYKTVFKMKDGMPLQYALGNSDFYGIKLAVNPSVLIPRPETEILAERAIAEVKNRGENCKYLDICTGSGAIAVAVAQNAKCDAYAGDISEAALVVARANALNSGVKIDVRESDLFAAFDGTYDVITANPPYIPHEDIKGLDEKVGKFEPVCALDGGADGLDFYRSIAATLDGKLAAGGVFIAEFGMGQADAIREIFSDYKVEIIKDMEGADRIALVTVKI